MSSSLTKTVSSCPKKSPKESTPTLLARPKWASKPQVWSNSPATSTNVPMLTWSLLKMMEGKEAWVLISNELFSWMKTWLPVMSKMKLFQASATLYWETRAGTELMKSIMKPSNLVKGWVVPGSNPVRIKTMKNISVKKLEKKGVILISLLFLNVQIFSLRQINVRWCMPTLGKIVGKILKKLQEIEFYSWMVRLEENMPDVWEEPSVPPKEAPVNLN